MTTFLVYLIIGLTTGAIYAIAGFATRRVVSRPH